MRLSEILRSSKPAKPLKNNGGMDLLTAAEDFLRGRIDVLGQLATPVQGALLGLHPRLLARLVA
jgi:hypothetical protein